MTSTYDHRVIQGAESGRFLQVVEAYLQGEHGFYERRLRARWASSSARRRAVPAPAAAAAAAARRRHRPVARRRRDRRGDAAGRAGGHLAAQGPPHARPPRRAAGPAGHRARGRPGARPRATVGLTPELMATIPAQDPAHVRAGRDAGRRAAAPARDLLRHDRLRDRAHRQPPPARVAAREDRVSAVPQAADHRRAEGAAPAPDRGRRARALHAQGLPRPEAVLDRGPRHDGPDARRDRSSSPPRTARARSSSAWRTAAGSTCSPTTSGRPYDTIFAEFEGASTLEAVTTIPQGGTGDVKYHHGAQGTYQLPNGDAILVNLESNPSHLEFVHPVVVGAARAAQTGRQGPHAHRDTNAAVPIVLHGDAAFPARASSPRR